jgi:hypothetical protein
VELFQTPTLFTIKITIKNMNQETYEFEVLYSKLIPPSYLEGGIVSNSNPIHNQNNHKKYEPRNI